MNYYLLLICCSLTATALADLDPDKFSRNITIPPHPEFKLVPAGTMLYFNNTNTNTNIQSSKDSRREVKTHIQQPPPPPPPAIIVAPKTQPTIVEPSTPIDQKPTAYIQSHTTLNASSWVPNWKDFLTFKTGAFVIGAVACGYGAVWIKFLRHAAYAQKADTWGAFQEHVPSFHLGSLEPLILAEALIDEIKRRYPPANPANLMPSLLSFNRDIEQESEKLAAFIAFDEWLSFLKLSILFPNQKKLIARAKARIERITIFKDAIAQWISVHTTRLVRNKIVPRRHSSPTFDLEMEEPLIEDHEEPALIESLPADV